MDHSLPGSSVHGILQARVLEWVAIGTYRVVQFIETESRMVVARSAGGEIRSRLRAYSFSFAR